MDAPLGIATAAPRFSWWLPEGTIAQEAYSIRVAGDEGVVWSAEREGPESVLVPYGGSALSSGAEYRWKVRVRVNGVWSNWAESRFEVSLLRPGEWRAPFIEPDQVAVELDGPTRRNGEWIYPTDPAPLAQRLHPAKYLRQNFSLGGSVTRARLYATAQGLYTAQINGRPVGDQILAPGYESYDRALSFQCYDVTGLLRKGANTLGMILGDGWYAGRIAFTGSSAQYGDRLRASWQLLVETTAGSTEILSDGSVESTDQGPIRYSDIFVGEFHDARAELGAWSTPGYDARAWLPVSIAATRPILVPFVGEPVRRVAELPATAIYITPAGDTVLDFGQVIAGRVRMEVEAPRGTTITLEHTEVLDGDGNYFDNIPQPNKDQTDIYVARGTEKGETWEPLFTFHGFRYVRVTGYPAPLRPENFTAIVISSDLPQIGGFECSDPSLNRLHQNIVWSQRANFLSIPTDCPQRERAGWTGDLQIFAPTAVTNMASGPFLRRWLNNVRRDQHGDGTVPVIVPASPAMSVWTDPDDPLMSISAAAGWGDAIVVVPWVLYQRYGDLGVLEENYDAMSSWVERQARVAAAELPSRLVGKPLSGSERERQGLLWNSEPNFGDWLAPSVTAKAKSLDDILSHARMTGELIGAMFHGHSSALLSRAATTLNRHAEALRWARHAEKVRAAFADEYIEPDGRLFIETQGILVLALAFGFVPEDHRERVVERLVELIQAAGNHLDTGFLSVPYLLDVLMDGGRPDVARELLWQRSAPSWLYEVDQGATTIWEEWEGIGSDGTVRATSFNHYAFGCVGDWLYRRVAGIQAVEPGYRKSKIVPDLEIGLTSVRAHHDTPYGRLEVAWQLNSNQGTVTLSVPSGTTAELCLPKNASQTTDVSSRPAPSTFTAGQHEVHFNLTG